MCLTGFHKINIPRICKSELTLLGADWGHFEDRLNKRQLFSFFRPGNLRAFSVLNTFQNSLFARHFHAQFRNAIIEKV